MSKLSKSERREEQDSKPKHKCYGYVPEKVYIGEYALPEVKHATLESQSKDYFIYSTATGIYKYKKEPVKNEIS